MVLELEVDGQSLDDVDIYTYTRNVNDVNMCEFSFAGTTDFDRTLFTIGNEVKCFRDGNLEFLGDIVGQGNFVGGITKVRVQGREGKGLGKQVIDVTSMGNDGEYVATQSSTIYNEIISQSTIFAINTVESSVLTDFVVNKSNSLYNSLKRLAVQLGQEIEVDYDNLQINIRDALGSSDVFSYKENNEITTVRYAVDEPQAKKVIVYGSGGGASQITGEATSGGYVPGDRVEVVTDLNIKTTDQANERAAAELAVLEQEVKNYSFSVNNFNDNIVIGDSGSLDAPSAGADDQAVRVIQVKRGMEGEKEFLSLQVANAEFNRLIRERAGQLAGLNRDIKELETAGQTLTNITANGVGNAYNLNSNTPLLVGFTVSTSEYKNVGGMPQFSTFEFDYDIDPFKQGAGDIDLTADADVQGSSADTQPGVAGDSGLTQPTVNGDTGNTQPSVTGTTSTSQTIFNEGVDSFNESISNSSWDFVAGVTYSDNYDVLYWHSIINVSAGGPSDLWMQIRVGGVPQITRRLHDAVNAGAEFGFGDAIGRIANTNGQQAALYLRSFSNTCTCDGDFRVFVHEENHSHSDGSLAAANHDHTDGSLSASNHDHTDGSYVAADHDHTSGSYDVDSADFNSKVTFGDVISDAGSINATSVDIFLDYWDGFGWVQKHSILNTGMTIDSQVDLSDGGTYPDAFGQWRVRMLTDSVNGDYGNGIVRLKHEIE